MKWVKLNFNMYVQGRARSKGDRVQMPANDYNALKHRSREGVPLFEDSTAPRNRRRQPTDDDPGGDNGGDNGGNGDNGGDNGGGESGDGTRKPTPKK